MVWGHTITKAPELVADVVGYSSQVVRGWAFSYFTSLSGMFQITPENVTNDDIEAELSSGIFDENFNWTPDLSLEAMPARKVNQT